MATKKALLVGINKYPNSPLRGCVNDCILIHKILEEKFGFKRKNIRLLADEEATQKNIINGLKQLVKNVVPGDTVFFHYSGHGSQVVAYDWTNNDEPDGRDEIICAIDLDWNDPIRDHQMGEIFKILPLGVRVVVILDCCHSGTGLRNTFSSEGRGPEDWKNKFYPPPPSNILDNEKITIDQDLNFILPSEDSKVFQTQKKSVINRINNDKQGEAILITGCQDNQTSADAYIGNRYHGALSFTLVDTLRNADYNISYKKLVKVVNKKMDKFSFTQNPQLECKGDYVNDNFLK